MVQHYIGVVRGVEEFGLLLKAAAREAERQINDVLRPLGITSSQAEALEVLAERGPMSLAELGGLLVAEGGHPSRLVDRMVTAGLVERHPAPDDRRRIELTVTAHGRALGSSAKQLKRDFGKATAVKLNTADLAATVHALEAFLDDTPLAATVAKRRTPPHRQRVDTGHGNHRSVPSSRYDSEAHRTAENV
jgi:DNA-binding MarR family transcriptional regulator